MLEYILSYIAAMGLAMSIYYIVAWFRRGGSEEEYGLNRTASSPPAGLRLVPQEKEEKVARKLHMVMPIEGTLLGARALVPSEMTAEDRENIYRDTDAQLLKEIQELITEHVDYGVVKIDGKKYRTATLRVSVDNKNKLDGFSIDIEDDGKDAF